MQSELKIWEKREDLNLHKPWKLLANIHFDFPQISNIQKSFHPTPCHLHAILPPDWLVLIFRLPTFHVFRDFIIMNVCRQKYTEYENKHSTASRRKLHENFSLPLNNWSHQLVVVFLRMYFWAFMGTREMNHARLAIKINFSLCSRNLIASWWSLSVFISRNKERNEQVVTIKRTRNIFRNIFANRCNYELIFSSAANNDLHLYCQQTAKHIWSFTLDALTCHRLLFGSHSANVHERSYWFSKNWFSQPVKKSEHKIIVIGRSASTHVWNAVKNSCRFKTFFVTRNTTSMCRFVFTNTRRTNFPWISNLRSSFNDTFWSIKMQCWIITCHFIFEAPWRKHFTTRGLKCVCEAEDNKLWPPCKEGPVPSCLMLRAVRTFAQWHFVESTPGVSLSFS